MGSRAGRDSATTSTRDDRTPALFRCCKFRIVHGRASAGRCLCASREAQLPFATVLFFAGPPGRGGCRNLAPFPIRVNVRYWKILLLTPLLLHATASVTVAQVTPPPVTAGQDDEAPDIPFSPRGAFLRSLVLPGWGQAYVGAPVRGAVYFTIASGGVWMSYVARRQLADARREQYWLREAGRIEPNQETDIALAREQQFEDWAALTLFIFFFAGADAYVSAYFADFSERIGVQPAGAGEMRIRANIPLGGRR
jgi:hypothetical protein